MHTLETKTATFNYNGDFDGEVYITTRKDGFYGFDQVCVEFEDLKRFFAEYIRRERIKFYEGADDHSVIFSRGQE